MKIKWKHIQQFQYFSWPMLWGSGAVSRYQVGWCAGPSTVAFMLEKIQNGSSWAWAVGSVVKHSYFHRGPEFSSHHPSWCLTPHWNSSSRGPDVLSWTHSAQNKNLKKNPARVSHTSSSQLNNVPRAGYVELWKTTRHRGHCLQHSGNRNGGGSVDEGGHLPCSWSVRAPLVR